MEVDLNAVEPRQHELKIVFDPVKQTVGLKFDSTEFKTWDYILGIIEMSRVAAEGLKQQTMIQAAMQQKMAQEQASRIFQGNR